MTPGRFPEIDGVDVIAEKDFSADLLRGIKKIKPPRGNRGGRKKKLRYLDAVCAFDIETTTIGDINFMYVWQWCLDGKTVVIGRTWEELEDMVEQIIAALPEDTNMIWYVHNLSYEFQYLHGVFDFKPDDVFATDTRRVVKCIINDRIELRCSMMLSNLSLAQFTHAMHVKHAKLDGEDIYHEELYPWSELTEHQMLYDIHDVVGLCEAVRIRMDMDGDTLFTVPLTSTGYPRRDMKRAMAYYSRSQIAETMPSYEVYQMLEEGFAGGYVHANRYYARRILTGLKSMDRCSSYPDVLMNCMFPDGRWTRGSTDARTFKTLIKQKKAMIMTLHLYDVDLRDQMFGAPYLSRDKTTDMIGGIVDNGRILSMEAGRITCTDIDFRIIHKIYRFRFRIEKLFFCDYEYLPEPFLNVVKTYYTKKTELKGIEGQELEYNKNKALLNALYGMVAQRPVKQDVIFDGVGWSMGNEDPESLLMKYQKRASLSYAVGVWTTAWARYRLLEGIFIVGTDFVYCDTDSVKYIDNGDDSDRWSAYNEARESDSKRTGSYAYDRHGKIHYMGVYELDGVYKRFVTYGAKRYAYEDPEGRLHITVSGVNKTKGAAELQSLERFTEGRVFYDSGKTESDYCDEPAIRTLHIDGGDIRITPYVIIRDTTYTLTMSEEYIDILNHISEGFWS